MKKLLAKSRCGTRKPPSISVAKIFDWGGRLFEKDFFVGQRYRRLKDLTLWPGLAVYQHFAKGSGLKLKVEQ